MFAHKRAVGTSTEAGSAAPPNTYPSNTTTRPSALPTLKQHYNPSATPHDNTTMRTQSRIFSSLTDTSLKQH
ncbi:hypothetical protein PMIN01_07342 [Paraphaeosphaeria minitans]|uniref:Uncharacterized protein n=1 Tax=Paraphaeosphaeria minitans TaxID=565426 RepID=A0A9P6KQD6_9PLEO|nr:hypothetical protein PMIN01_07342 [Paraphaeosphaeria minitans]